MLASGFFVRLLLAASLVVAVTCAGFLAFCASLLRPPPRPWTVLAGGLPSLLLGGFFCVGFALHQSGWWLPWALAGGNFIFGATSVWGFFQRRPRARG